MLFKIDTKETYTIVTPLFAAIDANLAVKLQRECEQLRQNGSNNFIVVLNSITLLDNAALDGLLTLHEDLYGAGCSVVFTELDAAIASALKDKATFQALNVAPTLIEAIDIISMEILERDLLAEE